MINSNIQITASLMCADQLNLGQHIIELEKAGIDGLHIDIMDHSFVPNLALSIDTFNQIRRITDLPMEVHLMVQKPYMIIPELNYDKDDRIIFHIESDFGDIVKILEKDNVNWGFAISPGSSFSEINENMLEIIDCILILTVNPGFAGQQMISSTYDKLKTFIEEIGKNYLLEYIIDGHVDKVLIEKYVSLGVYNFVGGTTGLYTSEKNVC